MLVCIFCEPEIAHKRFSLMPWHKLAPRSNVFSENCRTWAQRNQTTKKVLLIFYSWSQTDLMFLSLLWSLTYLFHVGCTRSIFDYQPFHPSLALLLCVFVPLIMANLDGWFFINSSVSSAVIWNKYRSILFKSIHRSYLSNRQTSISVKIMKIQMFQVVM